MSQEVVAKVTAKRSCYELPGSGALTRRLQFAIVLFN